MSALLWCKLLRKIYSNKRFRLTVHVHRNRDKENHSWIEVASLLAVHKFSSLVKVYLFGTTKQKEDSKVSIFAAYLVSNGF